MVDFIGSVLSTFCHIWFSFREILLKQWHKIQFGKWRKLCVSHHARVPMNQPPDDELVEDKELVINANVSTDDELVTNTNVVENDELLYRSVSRERHHYSIEESIVRISTEAFSDRNQSPSVDRSKLCGNDPKFTLKSPNDCVLGLVAGDVRDIEEIQNDEKGNQIAIYKIDVVPRPMEDNPSHAQIEPSPEYRNPAPFRKVRRQLAIKASKRIQCHGWEIEPPELHS